MGVGEEGNKQQQQYNKSIRNKKNSSFTQTKAMAAQEDKEKRKRNSQGDTK